MDAVHSGRDNLHWPIGKDARRLSFAARWTPDRLRKQMREMAARA